MNLTIAIIEIAVCLLFCLLSFLSGIEKTMAVFDARMRKKFKQTGGVLTKEDYDIFYSCIENMRPKDIVREFDKNLLDS